MLTLHPPPSREVAALAAGGGGPGALPPYQFVMTCFLTAAAHCTTLTVVRGAGRARFPVGVLRQLTRKETTMKWTTPRITEVCVGLEINDYLPAEL